MSMTSAEILTNQNMGDPLILASMSWSSKSSSLDIYKCRLCSRAFPSTQALGGHQTAHRKEKIERLIRIQRQAEIDELKYAADNDLLLSPEPISWAPPATVDQTRKMSNFMPIGNGTSPVPGSGLESAQGIGVGSSGCSENKASDDHSDQKKQKKRKAAAKLSECLENKASDDSDQKKQKKRKAAAKLSECLENKASNDSDQKKQKKRKSAAKLSECLENKASDDSNQKKKKKRKSAAKLNEYSENKASDDSDQKKQKKRKTIKLSECLENMVSDVDQKKQKKRKTTNLSAFSEINKASDAEKEKQKKRKSPLMVTMKTNMHVVYF